MLTNRENKREIAMYPLISFCMVGFNHSKYLEKCVYSLWNQNYKNIEIIVLDDGSSDTSVTKINELAKISICPFKVIQQKNTGNVALNFNTAFKYAKGDYVMFMSLDDYLDINAITEKIGYIKENHNVAFIANSKIKGVDDQGEEVVIPKLKIDTIPSPTIDDLLMLEFTDLGSFYCQGTLFNSDVIRKVGGFDEDLTGDDLVLRTKVFRYVKQKELSFIILKTSSCYYRQHNSNIHLNIIRQCKIALEYYDRYWPNESYPNIIIDWSIYAFKQLSFAESVKIFSMSPRSFLLLQSPRFLMGLYDISAADITFDQILNDLSMYKAGYFEQKNKKKRIKRRIKLLVYFFVSILVVETVFLYLLL